MKYLMPNQQNKNTGLRIVLIAAMVLLVFFLIPRSVKRYSGPSLISLPEQIPETALSKGDQRSGHALSKGTFLVADRNMQDPRFRETVVLLFSYDRSGASGLIINRPTEVKISSVFPDIGVLRQEKGFFFIGGPVSINQVFILLRSGSPVEAAQHIFGDVYVSSSMSVLREFSTEEKNVRLYAGYAGWTGGQLEMEVSRGDWHILKADAGTIFEREHSEIWPDLIGRGTSIQI